VILLSECRPHKRPPAAARRRQREEEERERERSIHLAFSSIRSPSLSEGDRHLPSPSPAAAACRQRCYGPKGFWRASASPTTVVRVRKRGKLGVPWDIHYAKNAAIRETVKNFK